MLRCVGSNVRHVEFRSQVNRTLPQHDPLGIDVDFDVGTRLLLEVEVVALK